jgi:hypothetical protein
MSNNTLDITPTPRILRTLGEIPFSTWQCIAELIDNSIDAFLSDEVTSTDDVERKIIVKWTSESAAANERTIEVVDNACGMSLEQLQDSVRAGYTSNDPIGNLGLFGMGFNISTARLGELTTIMSTRSGDSEWVGVVIDFQELNRIKKFNAPIIRETKNNPEESGTRISISRLKDGILAELPNKENEIRQRLEAVYSPLLSNNEIMIYVKGKQLRPKNHCVWSESRYIRYNEQTVPARIIIDRNLGDALFDLSRNCYLSGEEAEQFHLLQQEGKSFPSNIVERGKRLTGWLGIQRYADPNDFGIDFVRNGRKILVSDKSLFQYENPFTGQKEMQYPVDLGTSVGGRIIGELHVDYLIPTYQKNDFDKSDKSWIETVEAICGFGPFLPKRRKELGFTTPNTSPLCLLVNAYRRVDAGTKCLFTPKEVSRSYLARFRKGERDYVDDTLWWKAAQEEDQKQNTGGARSTIVNTGETPSDDIESYLGVNNTINGAPNQAQATTDISRLPQNAQMTPSTTPAFVPPIVSDTSNLDELIQRASLVSQLSGAYKFGNTRPTNVRVYELTHGDILYKSVKKPAFFVSEGIDCDFIYDPKHSLLSQYPITPKLLLLQYLSEKLKYRDSENTDIVLVFMELVETSMSEAKIDRQSLQEKAISVFDLLREKLKSALSNRKLEAINCIHESTGEVEETINSLVQFNPNLLESFQSKDSNGYDAIDYIPPRTLYRLVERFPEDIFDGKVLLSPYIVINLSDDNATRRARDESKDRILSFIKDALRIVSGCGRHNKDELTRASLSVDFLLKELNT